VGLCLGSFINALVWRLHEQENVNTGKSSYKSELELRPITKKKSTHVDSARVDTASLSIIHGRSMCPYCKHQLAALDLIPLFSWIVLKGKCRYCKHPISAQYPIVELLTCFLFVFSYLSWPYNINGLSAVLFIIWLISLVGMIALIIYDLYWLLLPNRIIYPLTVLALAYAIINIIYSHHLLSSIINLVAAVLIGGGIFYILFQLSSGKWIGGGDVRLGWLLGLIAGTPSRSILLIFLASLVGTIITLPLLASHRLKRTSTIPFGPFLILGLIITELFGSHILNWYQTALFAIH
jgi:leader peptidase (prepilin peptidase)/N-methyltransferase